MIPTSNLGFNIPDIPDDPAPQPAPSIPSIPSPPASLTPKTFFETEPDKFGLFQHYKVLPLHDPDSKLSIDDITNAPTFIQSESQPRVDPARVYGPQAHVQVMDSSPFAPFLNATVFRLMNWFYGSAEKTLSDLNNLVHCWTSKAPTILYRLPYIYS